MSRLRVGAALDPSPGVSQGLMAEALTDPAELAAVEEDWTPRPPSHDAPLITAVAAELNTAGTPCELELLLGLPIAQSLDAASAASLPVRVYIPFGVGYLPYSLRGAAAFRMAARLIRDLVRAGHCRFSRLPFVSGATTISQEVNPCSTYSRSSPAMPPPSSSAFRRSGRRRSSPSTSPFRTAPA